MSFDPSTLPPGSIITDQDQGDFIVHLPGGGIRRISFMPRPDGRTANVVAVQYSGNRVDVVTTEIKIEERD